MALQKTRFLETFLNPNSAMPIIIMKSFKMIEYLIIIITTLAIMDIITTLYGLRLGLYETNKITLSFIDIFGEDKGVIISMITKIAIVTLLYATYIYANERIGKIKERKYLYNTINGIVILSFMTSAIVSFNTVVMNIVYIVNEIIN